MGEVSVLKIRIKFSKHGAMKFIGHLDMMRFFQKVLRRAEIDIAFTEGFSPHMVMSFALPLGVGMTSDSEYVDIEIKTPISTREALERLNSVMVEAFAGFIGWEMPEFALLVNRDELYADIGEGERKLVPLEDLGCDIEG